MNQLKITARLKLRLKGGQASAAPPVGSTLGQYGVNMMDFIQPFNEQTKDQAGQDLTVHIFIYQDKSLSWRIVGQPVDELIRQELGIDKGSGRPNIDKVEKKLTKAQLTKIANLKLADCNTDKIESIERMVAGTARSMGVEIVEG